ncbi:helical backbone metal receptor [Virgibacillus sp. YIM 98842]|jgi:ABC-type Fe3+-hydroxamate transport system substrate-binding protein|uniref:ABC transporter substrate-binding protein n=1 Tax=Virgibacillus sp. YIM 98842 TaxID=2663533 RepID=UPI0013DD3C0D|nr:helical backbone metal receptor [Virgibacillus sp. YIM 98842]
MTNKKATDHLGREVEFAYPPKRIISIVPGITDILYSLELENEIVGRTRYCIYPKEKVAQAKTIGGTKKVKFDQIRELNPALIIAEKEENTKEIVEQLEKEFPVYVCEIQTVDDTFKIIEDLGTITDRRVESEKLQSEIATAIQSLPSGHGKKYAYIIWQNPYMAAGSDTYITSLLDKMGFTNAFADYDGRYPEVTEEDFRNADLDYIFLATEPFPFREKHIQQFSKLFPDVTVMSLDGEMFWYGPRMIEAAPYFNRVLNKRSSL